MSQILIALSVWLHALGTVILIGHFLLLSFLYLPVLAKKDLTILSEISRRSRPWMYLSLLIFLLTGVYLTLVDPNYLGVGDFGNAWAILMLVKHILVLGMIAMGFWFNAILRVGTAISAHNGASQALMQFRRYVYAMAVSGVLILLLTAVAQVE